MGDLLEDVKNDDSDFLAKSSKKASSGRKKSDLGLGPFRDPLVAGWKNSSEVGTVKAPVPVQIRSDDGKTGDFPVSFRSLSGLEDLSPEQTGLQTGLEKLAPTNGAKGPQGVVSPRLLRRNLKKVLRHLFEMASKSGERTTPKFNIVEEAENVGIPYESFRTAIKLLRNYNLIERVSYRSGPSGWCQFQIFKDVFKELHELYENFGSKNEDKDNSGLNSGLLNLRSSSLIETTTTPHNENVLDALDSINLGPWHISKKSLVKHVGPGKTCETVEELKEFLHKVTVAVDDMKTRGEKIRSPAGFLMHCLKEGYVGVPEGYVSLREQREREKAEQAQRELERIKAAKREKYESEYALFRENIDQGTKDRLVEGIKGKTKTKIEVVGKGAYEKSIKAELENSLRQQFCAQYKPEGLRVEAEQYLLRNGVGKGG